MPPVLEKLMKELMELVKIRFKGNVVVSFDNGVPRHIKVEHFKNL